MNAPASMQFHPDTQVVTLSGHWSSGHISAVEKLIYQFHFSPQSVDASNILSMDTAGAYLLRELQLIIKKDIPTIGLKDKFNALLKIVSEDIEIIESKPIASPRGSMLYEIGKATVELWAHFLSFLAFLGEIVILLLDIVINPLRLQWRSLVHEIDMGGYRALPIIAVMMSLIGVVVAYQLGVQLKIYAANIYVVDLTGVAILREFSPLIVSVIIAGRTSTSFAAALGTMKVNEELDALRTMGLSPAERLVLPKIIALFIALPLLVMWGNIFGVFGSMVMAKSTMGIDFTAFLERFRQEVAIKHLYLGLVKTPIFSLIIAGIGCYQGFQAEGSAESVGIRTTKAAVQAIFLIILADGLFSIIFNWMEL
ncbi:MAG: hypothetical protein A3E84_04675 [Gammaproteobacteria bacterium RIFCSPHIGHO2_12_FULL_42_13]|nr:MAG: hypothetical protein A3E84_04675 [Gammaproteobacteria bacterium RIFCSPHIGHO2_12_FULL_42_13]